MILAARLGKFKDFTYILQVNIQLSFCIPLLTPCHEIKGDAVGDHRCGIKERPGVRTQKQVVDEPGNKREGHQEFKMHRVSQIDQNNVDSTDHKGNETHKALII